MWLNPGLWYCSLVSNVKNEIRILRGTFSRFVVPGRSLVFVFNYFTMPLKSLMPKMRRSFASRAASDNICLSMNGEILHKETVCVLRLKKSCSSRRFCDMYFWSLMQRISQAHDRWLSKYISGSVRGDLHIYPSFLMMWFSLNLLRGTTVQTQSHST